MLPAAYLSLTCRPYGSNNAAVNAALVPALAPCADRVAEFLQFCVALRGRRYERNIVDFRGQYQGRFATFIPVMTAEYDVFDLPNVRGSVATHTFDAGDLSELARLGILRLAPFALQPPKRRDSIDAMLWRSIGMVADGERSVNPRQALTAYVSACEALFSKQDEAQRITCAGMAASVATDLDAVSHALSLAKEVYQARSDTVHLGMDAAYVVQARNFALASVLNIAGRTSMIRTRSDVRAWVLGNLSRLERREH